MNDVANLATEGQSKYKQCPICSRAQWLTEAGLADHVWHEHPESKVCMSHGKTSTKHGDPQAEQCNGSLMALCVLRIAREKAFAASVVTLAGGSAIALTFGCEKAA